MHQKLLEKKPKMKTNPEKRACGRHSYPGRGDEAMKDLGDNVVEVLADRPDQIEFDEINDSMEKPLKMCLPVS
jgi:hypothetical protein